MAQRVSRKCCVHRDLRGFSGNGLNQVGLKRTLGFVQSVQSTMRKKSSIKKEPWRTIKNGSVEVVIYEEKAGYRAAWYFAGSRERKFFTESAEAVEFAKEKAFSPAHGGAATETEDEAKLKYIRHLEQRMGDTPVHVAVDEFLWRKDKAKMDPQKTGVLLTAFLARLGEDKKSPSYIKTVKKNTSRNSLRNSLDSFTSSHRQRLMNGSEKGPTAPTAGVTLPATSRRFSTGPAM